MHKKRTVGGGGGFSLWLYLMVIKFIWIKCILLWHHQRGRCISQAHNWFWSSCMLPAYWNTSMWSVCVRVPRRVTEAWHRSSSRRRAKGQKFEFVRRRVRTWQRRNWLSTWTVTSLRQHVWQQPNCFTDFWDQWSNSLWGFNEKHTAIYPHLVYLSCCCIYLNLYLFLEFPPFHLFHTPV